jgi:hypothetical protein
MSCNPAMAELQGQIVWDWCIGWILRNCFDRTANPVQDAEQI